VLKKTRDTLELIMNDEFFIKNDFRFVGGTALSHIINHRLSEDLDFASLELPCEEIEAMIISKYGGTRIDHDPTMEDYVTNDGEDIDNSYMKFMLNGVKVEFFTPPFNLFEVSIWEKDKYSYFENSTLKIASLDTIIYMKTMAFWNRKKYRDLFDIYFVLSNNHISANAFINNYVENNITYDVETLHKKIQATTQFYNRPNDEGINTLVQNPKPYEWYRAEIEKYIHEVSLEKLYN
jgi:predicted nucleotidyltransferase component of viral defense system